MTLRMLGYKFPTSLRFVWLFFSVSSAFLRISY